MPIIVLTLIGDTPIADQKRDVRDCLPFVNIDPWSVTSCVYGGMVQYRLECDIEDQRSQVEIKLVNEDGEPYVPPASD